MVEASIGLDGVVINGCAIVGSMPPLKLYEIIGPPDRIAEPAEPAPFGHRNNQIHVYDDLGLFFHEHHWTRLAMGLTFVLWPEEETARFRPNMPFSGCLQLGGYRMPNEAFEIEVLRECPIPFERFLSGIWRARSDRFAIGMETKGARLRSGRRSSKRRVVSVDVSWPHDPWHSDKSTGNPQERKGGGGGGVDGED